ncbi:hypothetical protein M2271_006453 [Streptomyces sp. LBL]|nr:hypothetical protein [Streptomyces sp. LBL]
MTIRPVSISPVDTTPTMRSGSSTARTDSGQRQGLKEGRGSSPLPSRQPHLLKVTCPWD